jgi:hypothetical protein
MVLNKNVDDDDNIMTWIQATARLPSPSPPTPDARGAIVTTRIATTTTMHTAAAAQIKGETKRALKIVGGTTRGTGITTQRHATTNKLLMLRRSYHNQIAETTLGSEIIFNLWSILTQNICV